MNESTVLKALGKRPKTARQLAEKLGVCKLTVYRWIRRLKAEGYVIRHDLMRDGKTGPKARGFWIAI